MADQATEPPAPRSTAVATTEPGRTAPVLIGQHLDDGPSGRTMPADLSITVTPGNGADTDRAQRQRGERRQPMRGFEDTYTDIVDYIIRITHRIWEHQDVGYIYDTYAPGCFVYEDGVQYGVERVVENTVQAINAFPDTRSYADDVIWAGDDEQGFVTSHRYIGVGHHLGPWRWGEPTGRRYRIWGIANCVVVDNEIIEEWVMHNTVSKLIQLRVDPIRAAREYGNELADYESSDRQLPEVERLVGGRSPQPYPALDESADFDVEHFVRALFHNLYNRRDLSAVDRAYASNVRWQGASNRVGYGRQDVKAMARSLMSSFPDIGMQVDEVYWMGNRAEGFRVSVRWSAAGTHRGYGLYGKPTGRRIHLWGINQFYLTNGRISEDWMMFNEFDVMARLLRD